MLLLIVRHSQGQLTAASKLAMEKGARSPTPTRSSSRCRAALGPRCRTLLMATSPSTFRPGARLDAERISVPIVACGISNDRAPRSPLSARRPRIHPACRPTPSYRGGARGGHHDARELVYRDETRGAMWSSSPTDAPSDALGADHW